MANSKRYSKVDRKLLAIFSDTHAGHIYGLVNPETMVLEEHILRDGSSTDLAYKPVVLNEVQKFTWNIYQKAVDDTFKLAGKDDLMVIHNGDLSQGMKYSPTENKDLGSQFVIAASNMRPWFKYKGLKWFKLIWGTASHIFHDGSTPIVVYETLKREFPNVNVSIAKHSLINFFGMVADVAHHGPGAGSRNWLHGNTPRYYTKSIMADAIDNDTRPPDLIARGHFHVQVEEYVVKNYAKYGRVKTEFVMTPSYQGVNEFTRQVTRSKGKLTNGHVVFEIIDGKIYDTHWFVDSRDMRSVERIV